MNRKLIWAFPALILALGGVAWLSAVPLGRQVFRPTAPKASITSPRQPLRTVLPSAVMQTTTTTSVGSLSVVPNTITVSTPTAVLATVTITDPRLIPTSVNLLRLGGTGSPGILGPFHDDGLNGDAIAGDMTFSIRVTLTESTPGPLSLQASAAFRGLLGRVLSNQAQLTVEGLLLSDVVLSTPVIAQGKITSLVSAYAPNSSRIYTDLSMNIVRLLKGQLPQSITVTVLGGTVGGVTQGVSEATTFQVGQEVLLFLDGPDTNGKFYIPDGPLGTYVIVQDPQKGTLAIIDSGYASMDLIDPLDLQYADLLRQSSSRQLTLDALVALIRSTN